MSEDTKAPKKVPMKHYLVRKLPNSLPPIQFLLRIPASYKVTYGAMAPTHPNSTPPALRIYESKDKQRAVFMDVLEFRDLSLVITACEGDDNLKLTVAEAAAMCGADREDEE